MAILRRIIFLDRESQYEQLLAGNLVTLDSGVTIRYHEDAEYRVPARDDFVHLSGNEQVNGRKDFIDGITATTINGARTGWVNSISFNFGATQSFGMIPTSLYSFHNVDLGESSHKWKDLYLSGSFNVTCINFVLSKPRYFFKVPVNTPSFTLEVV